MSQQDRLTRRATVDYPATVTLIDETRHQAVTVDLSPGGVSLHTETRIRLAQYCAVSFKLDLGERSHPVLAMGQVVYSDPTPERGYKTGVQFLRIDPGSLAAIAQLLNPPA